MPGHPPFSNITAQIDHALTCIFHKIFVAAVYDRRKAGEATVIDRRYNLSTIFGWCKICG